MTVFKQVVGFAEFNGYIVKSPLRGLEMLKVSKGRVDFLTHQEILQLLRANSTENICSVLIVALNTGMRIGELTGLCWDRINFETETIEISRTMTRDGLKETTKTNLTRHVPMNYETKAALTLLLRLQRNPRFVFTNDRGEPHRPDHFSERVFAKALRRAGIRPITFHILRHTFASHFVMKGGSIFDLQKILGHTKVEMTTIYAHLSHNHLRSAMNTVRFSVEATLSDSPFSALPKSTDLERKLESV